jgi:hypothetical protein
MSSSATFRLRLADGTEFGPAPMELIRQWASQGRVPADAWVTPSNGVPPWRAGDDLVLKTMVVQSAGAIPTKAAAVTGGPTAAVPEGAEAPGFFPYKNPHALTGYYLAIFSLIPCIGLLLAIPAIVLGIMGVRAEAREPRRKGGVHAWVAIILGGVMMLLWGGIAVVALIAAIQEAGRP